MELSERKYKNPLPHFPKHLPVNGIDEKNQSLFTGIFNGKTIEVRSKAEAAKLIECGCIGYSAPIKPQYHIKEGYYELYEGWKEHLSDNQDTSTKDTIELEEYRTGVHNLFLEEAFFLHFSLKCLQIYDSNSLLLSTEAILNEFIKAKENFLTLFVAYHYLRTRNWVVRSGLKFGSDYILYTLGPHYYHSKYMVKVRTVSKYNQYFPSVNFLGWYRVAETSRKECLLMDIQYPDTESSSLELLNSLNKFKVCYVVMKRFNYYKRKYDVFNE